MKLNIPHQAFRDFISINGFQSIQQAIYKLGTARRFNQAVKDFYLESLKPKAKEIDFAKGYFIHPDGKCFSEKTKRFLKPRKTKGKTPDKFYLSYDIKPYGSCLIARLVMFYFGNHDYTDIKSMPKILLIDGNPENYSIDNLKFTTQSEINVKYGIKPKYNITNNATISLDCLDKVSDMLSKNYTYPQIATELNTSPMAVYRFVKKHFSKQTQFLKKS